MSNLTFYKRELDIQTQVYKSIESELSKYRKCNVEFKSRINKLLKRLKLFITMYPDRSVIIFRSLGLWGLPPDILCLEYIKNLIETHKIDTVIDYGAGVALWAKMVENYVNSDVLYSDKGIGVIAYDIREPMNNNEINKQKGFFRITTSIDLCEYTNSLLMLIWPPKESRMAQVALENFCGLFVVYYGDLLKSLNDEYYTANEAFHVLLKREWDLINSFNPLGKLIDENGEFKDKIYIYKRKLVAETKEDIVDVGIKNNELNTSSESLNITNRASNEITKVKDSLIDLNLKDDVDERLKK